MLRGPHVLGTLAPVLGECQVLAILPGMFTVVQRKPDEDSSKMREEVGRKPSTTRPALKKKWKNINQTNGEHTSRTFVLMSLYGVGDKKVRKTRAQISNGLKEQKNTES